jgi:hypothetical protein
MNYQTKQAIARLDAFLAGYPVSVNERFVQEAIRQYRIRSTSLRGFVLVIGNWLVLLAEHAGAWTAQKLPWPPEIATQLGHQHSIATTRLPDGKDVLQCVTCGSEW